MIKDKVVKYSILILIALIMLPATGLGFRLREVASLPLEKADRIYGQKTDNIIIEKEDRLQFLNRRHKVRSEVKFDSTISVAVGENGLFYGLVYQPTNGDSISLSPTMTIYNNREIPLWSVYDLVEGDYYVGLSGDIIISVIGKVGWFSHKMYIYHPDKPVILVEVESFESLQFNEDGDYFLVDAGPKGMKLYNTNGELIHEYDPQKMTAFSEGGIELVAYDYKGFARIYDGDRRKMEVNMQQLSIRDIVLHKAAKILAIIYDFKIDVVDSDNGKILWEYASGKDGGLYVSLDISPNNEFIACGIDISKGKSSIKENRHTQGFLFVYDLNGQSLQEVEFTYDVYSKGLPDVRFLPDNRTIVVRNAESLHFVEIL